MGPTTYQEGFTLVKRSDLYDASFQCEASLPLSETSQLLTMRGIASGQIKSKLCKRAVITAAHVQHGIERIRDGRSPMRRQNTCIQGLQYQQNCTLQTSSFSLNDAEWSG